MTKQHNQGSSRGRSQQRYAGKDQKLLRKLEKKAKHGQLNDYEQSLLLDLQRNQRHPDHLQKFPHTPSPAPERKLTLHDLCDFSPKNAHQHMLQIQLDDDNHVAAIGSAGTGKTYVLLYHMLRNVLDREHPRNKLVIFRSNVEGRDLGHRPGDVEEKMADFEQPYRTACAKLFGRPTAYDKLKEQGLIEFRSTSFERGVDYEDCEMLLDECQNLNFHELDTMITRPARGSRMGLAGDTIQSDLVKKASDATGLPLFLRIMEHMADFKVVRFTPEDNVRSGLSRDYLIIRDRMMAEDPDLFKRAGMAVVAA